MTRGWLVLLVLAGWAGLGLARPAAAQVAVYAEGNVSDLTNLLSTDLLYGGTVGLLYQGPTLHHRLTLDADVQGRFVTKSNEGLDGVTVGPRVELGLGHGFAGYGELLVGFARYNNTTNVNCSCYTTGTTDSTLQLNAGVTRRLSPRLDALAEYSYAQFYGLGGQYNPKTFSLGAIFHISRR